jgi:hypothetical protein
MQRAAKVGAAQVGFAVIGFRAEQQRCESPLAESAFEQAGVERRMNSVTGERVVELELQVLMRRNSRARAPKREARGGG